MERKSSTNITQTQAESEVRKVSTKGQSQKISLSLFQEGKSIQEIAEARSLTEGTIQSHLISFIGTDLKATDLLEVDKLEKVLEIIKQNPDKNTTELKYLLGNDYSYADVRIGQREMSYKS
jgi:uncharacterized protein YpbB